MFPSYFNLFRINFPNQPAFIPVAPSTAIDWNLIQSLDPSIVDIQDQRFLQFIYNFPTYKVTNNDQKIIDHPLILRLFLLLQKSLLALTQITQFYIKKVSKQQNQINDLSHTIKEYKTIIESDQFNETKSKPEKCYACGQRFFTIGHLKQHIKNSHTHLMIPWKQILSNTYENKSEEQISNLRIDMNNLRQYISEQDERYSQNIGHLNRKYQNLKARWIRMKEKQNLQKSINNQNQITVVQVQPPYGPWRQLKEHPKFNLDNRQKIQDENYYDEQYQMMEENVKHSIQKQAALIMNKKTRNYHLIRDQIRINLEREIPMPKLLESNPQKPIPIYEMPNNETSPVIDIEAHSNHNDRDQFCISDSEQSTSNNNSTPQNTHEAQISPTGQQNVFMVSDHSPSPREVGEVYSDSSDKKTNRSSFRHPVNQLISDNSSDY